MCHQCPAATAGCAAAEGHKHTMDFLFLIENASPTSSGRGAVGWAGCAWAPLRPQEPLPSPRELQCLSPAQEHIKFDGCPEIIISGKPSLISVWLAGFYCFPFLRALILSLNSCQLLPTRVLPPTPLSSCCTSAPRTALGRVCDPEPTHCKLGGRAGAFGTRLGFIRVYFYGFGGLWEQRGRWLQLWAGLAWCLVLPAGFGKGMLLHTSRCASLMAPCPHLHYRIGLQSTPISMPGITGFLGIPS